MIPAERGVLARARRKASTNIGSSTAVNDRGTHQTLTRYVRRAGGVDVGLRERVWENAASRVCHRLMSLES